MRPSRARERAVGAVVAALLAAGTWTMPSSATDYEYDEAGRLLRVSYDNGSVIRYGYDLVGNRTWMMRSDGVTAVLPGDVAGGDLDGDGSVGPADLALLRASYGAGADSPCRSDRCDLTGDGRIDLADIQAWYATYEAADWLPADWTGAGWGGCEDLSLPAPDGVVDFHDLAVLAHFWGGEVPGLLAGLGAASSAEGRVGPVHLERLEQLWLAGDGPVAAVCRGAAASGAAGPLAVAALGGQISLRQRPEGLRGDERLCEILLSGCEQDVRCFQFRLRIGAEGEAAAEAAAGDLHLHPAPSLGSGESSFADCRWQDGSWLVTGARLSMPFRRTPAGVILGTIELPGTREHQEIELRDGIYTTLAGQLRRAEGWSGRPGAGAVPAVVALEPVQPNPFNPLTSLRFAVPTDGRVSLRVYDSRGRLVRTLVDGAMTAGWHECQWQGEDSSGRGVSSGVYFFRLEAGAVIRCHKGVLAR